MRPAALHTSDKRRWQLAAVLATGIIGVSVAGTTAAAGNPVHVPKCYDLTGTCQNDLPPVGGSGGMTGPPGMSGSSGMSGSGAVFGRAEILASNGMVGSNRIS